MFVDRIGDNVRVPIPVLVDHHVAKSHNPPPRDLWSAADDVLRKVLGCLTNACSSIPGGNTPGCRWTAGPVSLDVVDGLTHVLQPIPLRAFSSHNVIASSRRLRSDTGLEHTRRRDIDAAKDVAQVLVDSNQVDEGRPLDLYQEIDVAGLGVLATSDAAEDAHVGGAVPRCDGQHLVTPLEQQSPPGTLPPEISKASSGVWG